MQELCHRCGGELPQGSGESPFCPHCGTPQLFLALENQSVETGGEPTVGADGSPSTGRVPPPRPQQVEWKTAIRCAVLVAAIGSVLTLAGIRVDVLSPVSLVWIMFASLITLGLYQKRRPSAWIDVRVGARIGVLVGMCLALGLGIVAAGWGLVARFGLHSMGGFDAAMTAQMQEGQRQAHQWMVARSMPVAPDALAFEQTPEFRAVYVLSCCAFVSGFLLVVSTLGGAFAGLLKMRRGPAV
jgi:hypothetical protein